MDYSVKMVFKDHTMTEDYQLPKGYRLRFYKRGEEQIWARVETLVNEFETTNKALEHFKKEFGDKEELLEERLQFLENESGEVVGTIMSWFGNFRYENEGRIHWVGIIPEYQGKGLSKPMLSSALNILKKNHQHIYLTTQYSSIEAINLYKKFGFVAWEDETTHPDAWNAIYVSLESMNQNRK